MRSSDENAKIQRDENGIPHVEAGSAAGLYYGMGYCHGKDRGLQMLVMRIIGRGQASEFLESGEQMLAIDIFFRRMNWHGEMEAQTSVLPPEARALCEAYCSGVNAAFRERTPWELKLLGYKPAPWTIEDSILMLRMAGFLTLAQSQGEMERLLVEMVQAGVDRERLESLFPGILDGLNEELLRQVTMGERLVPRDFWNAGLPRMMASNNWVVSGEKTESGKPMLANDPHLEVNRLPNVWYEISLKMGARYITGATVPGLPAVIIGRNPDVSWGATYSFMDSMDSWMERCRDGRYEREVETEAAGRTEWPLFRARRETIRRKKKPAAEVTFYENDHGVLDGDPYREGCYLATRWSSAQAGTRSLCQGFRMWDVKDVREGVNVLGPIETAWNWVLADRQGNIGYQMSGLMPKRRAGISGFVPLPGWEKGNDWQGFVNSEDLPRAYNPAEGYFVTANQDLNAHGKVRPINMPMGAYRADRIRELLARGTKLRLSDHYAIQHDVYSPQAEEFLRILKPLLPETQQGRILGEWNFRYDKESRGAYLFERFYKALLREVFGKAVGEAAFEHLEQETGTFADFYGNFDRVLLSAESPWFRGESRDSLYARVAEGALAAPARAWGEARGVRLAHILFGGKIPRLFGFDRGPVTLAGGRATPHQGQIYRSAGRETSFAPSFRMVTDMAGDESHTNLAGGPSDRRFSRWYCSDLENWKCGRYKSVSPEGGGKMLPK